MIPLHTAEQLARHAQALLAPACHRLMVVGSVRRQKAQTKDVELAVIAKPALPVFGDAASSKSQLETLLARLVQLGDLKLPQHDRRVDGPRQKRFLLPQAGGVELELWIADSVDNFGNVAVIRTGDHLFSRALVTQRSSGGLMPRGMKQHEGYLWRDNERLSCPDEASFFAALGIEDIPDPSLRDEAMAHRLRAKFARKVKAS